MLKPMCRHDEIRDTLIYLANNPIPDMSEVIAPFSSKLDFKDAGAVYELWHLAHDLADVLRAVNGGE